MGIVSPNDLVEIESKLSQILELKK
jgi:hypothetical protein